MRAMLAFAVMAFFVAFSPAHSAGQDGLEKLAIVTASGRHVFSVEVMRTEAQRERGLMERCYLPPDRGMLFDFHMPQEVAMWMKDTYLPLDMLFIRADGTILRIAHDTEPLSLRTISSGGEVLGVLEVNAGTADKIGAKPGDKVEHPLFGSK